MANQRDLEQGIARVPESLCPECGNKLNTAGTPDGGPGAPSSGDLAVCIRCGAVQIYGADLRARGFTEAEKRDLLANQELLRQLRSAVERIHFIRHSIN
jgi:hypothetical protein